MGVVIGETAEVGDDVLLYQGVVLGGTSLEKKKRHPTVQDGVVIGAGAILLGPITIGRGSRIGAGSVVVKSVPADSTVVGVPGRVVKRNGQPVPQLEHGRLPDPIEEVVRGLLAREEQMARDIQDLRARLDAMRAVEGSRRR